MDHASEYSFHSEGSHSKGQARTGDIWLGLETETYFPVQTLVRRLAPSSTFYFLSLFHQASCQSLIGVNRNIYLVPDSVVLYRNTTNEVVSPSGTVFFLVMFRIRLPHHCRPFLCYSQGD